jgi:polysaccharide pyruvyl transferase WcaK-like protein
LKEKEVVEDMKRYALITPRESITAEALKAAGVTDNVKLYPDPAFSLQPVERALPATFQEGNTIGINISPMIVRNETVEGITIRNYRRLIDHILQSTDCSIALIPHVMWNYNDDRLTLAQLYQDYQRNERVILFEDMSCQHIKYIISKCRFFIGARTHATIAAYSSCVPTLVVGYSVKARGIARDLFGTEEHYVLPVQTLSSPEELIAAYDWMMEREQEIRTHLEKIMPDYCGRAAQAGEELRRLWIELHA